MSKADRRLLAPTNRSATVDAAMRAAAERERGVDLWARSLSVGSFAATPFEGRAYWPEPHEDLSRPSTRDGIPGQLVHIFVFVPDALAATQRTQAERRYDKAVTDRAAIVRNGPGPTPAPTDAATTDVAA